VETTLEEHFKGKSTAARDLYDRLIEVITSFGPITIEPRKTGIYLVNRTALGGISIHKNHIVVGFKTDNMIEHEIISNSLQISRNRYQYTVKISSPNELEGVVREWLRDAYSVSG
jgi:hypothetical protein